MVGAFNPGAWRIRVDFAQEHRNPTKHVVGIGVVILMHVLVGWALVSGLARKVVEVIKAPIETKIIEEVKPPPPPPENLPPPPKFAPPPPSFVPPPEVVVAPPPTPAPAITTTTVAPPPAPVTIAPAPAPVPAPPAPPAPRPTARAATIDVSTCAKPEYPVAARRSEAQGVTRIRFTVDADGKVAKAEVERASGSSREHRLLDRTAVDALSLCRFRPGTDENGKPVGASSVVEYAWKLD
jgi:protein TonB